MHAISVSARVVALPLLVTLMLAGCGGGGSSGGGGGGGSSTPSLPIAEFTASPLTVQVGSPVQFTDGSTGATGWQWDFNSDGTPEDYGQNPSHVYTAPGIYDVTLQVSNAAGINTRLRMAYITVTPPPPVAEFVASPTTLTLGSSVQFTDQSTNATAWSWDFNNDGTADSTAQNPAHVYGAAGTYTVVLTASNSGGNNVRTRAAYITVNPPPSTTVDIDVDTDRNGSVDNAADEAGEEAWSTTRGAVFYWNIDDDDNNAQFDHSDTAVNGATDALDLARVVIRQISGAPSGGSVTVNVTPAAAQSNIRIFQNNGGTWTSIYSTGASFTLPVSAVQAGDIELGIECRGRLSSSWDGIVFLTLDVRDAASVSLGTDQVRLRCAPPIMNTNLWVADRYYIVSITSGTSNNTAARTTIQALCNAAGITYQEVPGSSYSNDRWLQDSSEPMTVLLPSASGRRRVDSVLQLARYRAVDAWCQNILWDPNFDFIQRFASTQDSQNYGGNLEVVPPHNNGTTNYPWGRIISGGPSTLLGSTATDNTAMDSLYKQFFTACSLQGPSLEIPATWLAVGHIDEFLAFVPAPNRARGWAIAFASPTLARNILQTVQSSGGGNLTVFAGRTTNGWQTTVNAILGDAALMTYNTNAQTKLDTIKQQLITQCGLTAADFVELPVLFENVGSNYAAALNPGVTNLVSLPLANGTTHLVVPDPEGPDQPTDVWAAATKSALEALGTASNPVQVTFVDVFYSYHDLLGEIHCGTNNVRTPPAGNWWD